MITTRHTRKIIIISTSADKFGRRCRSRDREEDDFYVGRTEYDSPEVDPEVLVTKDRKLDPGHFYQVQIEDAQAFDLYGKVLSEI